ncbi:MAG: hypothetical protein JXB10_15805, partial [Pirellulales bacterium]|nr:hypothetical protein [Pirellulales bacterium]
MIFRLQVILERYLLLWLVLLCGVAYGWPAGFTGDFDPFLATQGWLGYMIAVTMLAIGSLLPRDEVAQVVRRWPAVLAGTAIQ